MTPALARIKRGVRDGVATCGGVDGAGATANRGRSVAGDWNNLNHPAFPPIDCALALDEIAVAGGKAPPIASAYARELGGVFVMLPDVAERDGHGAGDTLAVMVMALGGEFGDLARSVSASLADGIYEPREAAQTLDQLHRLDAVCASLRGVLTAIGKG